MKLVSPKKNKFGYEYRITGAPEIELSDTHVYASNGKYDTTSITINIDDLKALG